MFGRHETRCAESPHWDLEMADDKVRWLVSTSSHLTNGFTSQKWVRITSDDGFTFVVERKVALASQTLAASLNEESECSQASKHYSRSL